MSTQIDPNDACRICLQSTRSGHYKPINIFESKLEASESPFSLMEALSVICGLNVFKGDGYPELICPSCLSQLREAFELRQLAQRSQEILQSSLLPNTSIKPDPEYTSVGVLPDNALDVQFFDESVPSVKSEPDSDSSNSMEWFHCCGCDKSFDSEKLLRRHSSLKHRPKKVPTQTTAGMIRCHVCYAQVRDHDWEAHRAGKNSLKPLKECEFCKYNFTRVGSMNMHLQRYHSDGLYKCCGCKFSSQIKSELENHSLLHREVDPEGTIGTESYKCLLCYAQFGSVEELKSHEQLPYSKSKKKSVKSPKMPRKKPIEPSSTEAICCRCLKVFQSIAQLKDHQQTEHPPASVPDATEDPTLPVQCPTCHKRFTQTRLLQLHLDFTTHKKFRCPECPVTRRSVQEMLDHIGTHTGERAFLCCGCQEGFCSNEALKEHSLAVHAIRPKFYHDEDYEQKRPIVCNICYRRYRSKLDLSRHQQVVYEARVHTCEVCGKCFQVARRLNLHMATHVEQATHPCPTCGKMYRHATLARHCMLKHKRPTEHRCRICQAVFSDSSNLNSHLISHSDVRKYKCNLCKEAFKRPGHLRMHVDTAHTQAGNFCCRHCLKRFSTPSSLRRHEISHTGKYPYRCEVCDKPFKTRKYYVGHYENHVEDSAKVYQCHLCKMRYSRQYFLSNHLKFNHRIEPTEVGWNAKFGQNDLGYEEHLDDEMEDDEEHYEQDA